MGRHLRNDNGMWVIKKETVASAHILSFLFNIIQFHLKSFNFQYFMQYNLQLSVIYIRLEDLYYDL